MTESELAGDERWTLICRIASCQRFSKAAQLRDLLLFLGKRAILSPGIEDSEQEIGCQVLGRKPDYDTQADNIVRVQLRHLRHKLDEYFEAEGHDEPVLVTIPKGSRVPHFDPRAPWTAPIADATPPEPAPHSTTVAALAGAPASSRTRRILYGVSAVLVVGVVFLAGRYSPGAATAPGARENLQIRTPLMARLFPAGGQTTVVIADSSLVFVQDVLHTELGLDDFTKGTHRKLVEAERDARLKSVLELISSRQYTSLADATISGKMLRMGQASGAKVVVRYSRHMGIRDFSSGNFVLVGSKRGIPWVDLFEPDLGFRLERIGPGWHFGFRNRQPRTGEAATYATSQMADGSYETYATVSLVPNVNRTGDVLLLDGTMMESTEAAGEFAMSEGFNKVLAENLRVSTAAKLPYFEILLKIRARSGAPHKVEVVAWRNHSSE